MKALERPKKPTAITPPVAISQGMTLNDLLSALEDIERQQIDVADKKHALFLSNGYELKEVNGKVYYIHPKGLVREEFRLAARILAIE